MENGIPVHRNHTFPAGLRVLVVDDDLTWLKILEKMLKKCSYEVTTCCLAREALNLLREKKDRYDIVISDVNMPDMDGFKLLEHVGLEMDLPLIMMSVDGETSRVMRGVQHGACDYLLKPIRMKELRNIWQHVIRKRIHETGYMDGLEVIPMTRSTSDQYDWQFLGEKEHLVSLKKRKDINEHDNKESADASCMKKSRVVWSVNLHQKFVDAVNQIGFDKVGPKKILDIMKVPGLTRENVASHLQKYRLYLTRLHKEDDLQTACSGNKHSDSSLKDADQIVSPHDTVYLYQDNAAEEKYSFFGNLLLQNVHPRSNGNHLQGTVPEPASSVTTTRGIPVSKNKRNSQLEFNHTIASPESEEGVEALNPKIQEHYSWFGAPEFQIEQEHKPLAYLESGFSDLQAGQLQSILSFSSGSSVQENDTFCSAKNFLNTCNLNQTSSWMGSLQIQPIANNNTFEFLAAMMSIKDPDCTAQLGCRLPFAFMDDDFQISCFEADSSIESIVHENINLPSYSDPEISNNLYDALRSAWEHSNDPGEYRAVDQGLFIV